MKYCNNKSTITFTQEFIVKVDITPKIMNFCFFLKKIGSSSKVSLSFKIIPVTFVNSKPLDADGGRKSTLILSMIPLTKSHLSEISFQPN